MPETLLGYHRRNTLRHVHHDYTHQGAYFITICTHDSDSWFGQVVDTQMQLNPLGQLADDCWRSYSDDHTLIRPDCHVVMPNHMHILFWILAIAALSSASTSAQQRKFGDAIAGSVSTMIGSYKSAVTQKAKNQGLIPRAPMWQDNFHDRIVRNEEELNQIRQYIHNNPAQWNEDQLHPTAPPNQFNRKWIRG